MYFARVALFVALVVGLALPALVVAMAFGRPRRPWLVALALMLFTLDVALLLLPHVGAFAHLRWNWQGKVLSVAWPLVFGQLGVTGPLSDTGVTSRPARGSLRPALVAAVLVCSTNLVALAFGERAPLEPETLAYQLTMPGLAEEFVYRGALLALLDRAFGRPWRVFGAEVGWGWVVTSALFLAIHVVSVDARLGVRWFLDPEGLAGIALAGVVFGWIRARSGSVWPCVVAHNVANAVLPLGSLLLGVTP